MISGGDVIVEREHGDGGLADREGRRGTTGGSSPSNRSPVSGSSAETRGRPGMNLGADVVRDQANDALAIGWRQSLPVSESHSDSRSTQSRPSGLSITSTIASSSRSRAIAALRSMRAPREFAVRSPWRNKRA
jgi:hypothetical protein